ncbi:hypothetical protein KRZ98_21550 [Sphingobium sp. AS12]|nr:hypothetical protein [Sphingobium sp. AS12]MBV2150787.1 hypothetical protein [Sphingobium sp. AS12]
MHDLLPYVGIIQRAAVTQDRDDAAPTAATKSSPISAPIRRMLPRPAGRL